jgi:hypothetical protein
MLPTLVFAVAAWLVLSHVREINHAVASGLGKMLFHASTNMVAAVHLPPAVAQTTAASPVPSAVAFAPATPAVFQSKISEPTNGIYCVGFCLIGGPVTYLSDGSTVTPDDGLEKIERNRVTIYGRVYPLKPFRNQDSKPAGLDSPSGASPFAVPPAPAVTSPTMPIPPAWTPLHPVNQADILPAIHAQGGAPPPVLNGFQRMAAPASPIGQGRQNYAGE